MRFIAAVAVLSALVAPAQDNAQSKTAAPPARGSVTSPLNKAALESYLRNLELWPPQVQVKIDDPKPFIRGLNQVDVHLAAGAATKDVSYFLSSDGKTVIRGTSHNLDRSPFQFELDQLKLDHEPGFGPANAPITMAVFSDFECPVCREEAKELREKVPAEFPKELRVVFVDYPLEAIHPWAKASALAGRCVYRMSPASFWDYHDWMFEHQPEIKADNLREKITEWAKSKHLDDNHLGQCLDTRATESEVEAEIAMGKRLQVDSTPTLFLNGRRLAGHVPWQNLSQILKMELEFEKHPVK